MNLEFSKNSASGLSSYSQGIRWETEDFIKVHKLLKESGKHNFEGCRIPIPTAIRHDRFREALGDEASPKEVRVLSLLEFGMPIDCKPSYGVKKLQKIIFRQLASKRILMSIWVKMYRVKLF